MNKYNNVFIICLTGFSLCKLDHLPENKNNKNRKIELLILITLVRSELFRIYLTKVHKKMQMSSGFGH